ncbi:MAG TPA: valine--tRNA ligase [Dietzia timorensis]|uniref:Valine--tRNA ligase n=1 Tax=Dietzia timorensis TaxID=499555 RepID=A0A921JXZ0_9ACTN|nr:valine--tRNA ligase [Dietzia timorensis]HJE90740.1 valine--tRNA ligase [Dietzia timorensis]
MTTEQPNAANPAQSLPKSWNPADHEDSIYSRWVEAGYFEADASSEKPPYSIVLPPPNVTGSLHMGHALDHTLMDALSRRKRMQGYEVLWLPGMDHAGIATQTLVEKKLNAEGTSRHEIGREAFIEKVWEWKANSGGTIGSQMRRIGDGVDWSRERFTLDEGLSRAVQTIFKELYDQGLIYRAERLVNWSPVLGTAISDIEVKYSDVDGELVTFRYGSVDGSGPYIDVATTRLETMLGDTAIAVAPGDERYAHLVGQTLPHPIREDWSVVVVADEYVDPEFGSGAVKITPAHDPNDFEVAQRHDLPMPTIMDAAARIEGTGTKFDGLDRYEARSAINAELATQGRIIAEKRPYVHSVGHSERSGEAIEPRLSMQWWVKVADLAKMAGDAVRDGDTVIHPASQEPRWFDWVDNMHDWTISRQLWWGHRIPIWYGPDGDVVCVGPDESAPEGYEQDPDVLDTWFSSGLWPFSTMGWPESTTDLERFYPTSVLVTGYDILFFWVARMMMFGTFVGQRLTGDKAVGGPVPFRDVFLHGLVRDEHGQKMSKSKGNGIDPLDWVDQYGADALRFTLARGAAPGGDLSVGDDHAQASRNFATKLFNATKFALMNGAKVGTLPETDSLSDADRWILHRLGELRVAVDASLDAYEFSKACDALYHFTWDELCDWYLELAKVQFGDERAENTKVVLGHVLDTVLRLLHPFIPFVTEVLWTTLTGEESLVIAEWPSSEPLDGAEESVRRIEDTQKLITEVRRFRSDQGLKPGQKAPAKFIGLEAVDADATLAEVRNLARLTEPDDGFAATASIEVRLARGTVTVEIDISDAIDVAAERKRLEKDLAGARKELETTGAKLGNESFLAKAPEHVVDKIRGRQEFARAEVERITARLEGMPQA